jgi:branched-chain amino acid transport system permease protein
MSAAPPLAYRIERATRASRIGTSAMLVGLLVLAALPWFAGRPALRLAVEFFCYLTLAQMWNLLAGYAGLVSVGQQAFVGLGGYALFALAILLGVHPLVALPLASLIAGLAAVPTAFIVFRLRGAYFAIGTWVVAEVYRLGFAQVSALGGGSGLSLPAALVRSISRDATTRDGIVYWIALALGVGAVLAVYLLLRSRYGLALTAIRDSERAAESLGVDHYRVKLLIYLAVATLTGFAGALLFLQKLRISPDAAFSVNDWTAFVIFMTVIGGIGHIEGPMLGTVIFFALRGLFADLGAWYLLMLGAVAVGVMLFAPRGLWGWLADRYDLQLFPVQRRVRLLDPGAASRPRPSPSRPPG